MTEDLDALQREEQRIRFRQRLMKTAEGRAWLSHVCRLYEHRERLIAPDHIGMPASLARAMGET